MKHIKKNNLLYKALSVFLAFCFITILFQASVSAQRQALENEGFVSIGENGEPVFENQTAAQRLMTMEDIEQLKAQDEALLPTETDETDYSEQDFDEYSVIVRLKNNDELTPESALLSGLDIASARKLNPAADPEEIVSYVLTLEEPGRENVIAAVEQLKIMPQVDYAQPNYLYTLCLTPDDTYYSELSNMINIEANSAWNTTTGSSSIVVGVIDTGVNYNHEDLAANIWNNPSEIPNNGEDDDGNGYPDDVHGYDFVGPIYDAEEDIANPDSDPMDYNGHGTHVTGIIGAIGNNSKGVAGVAWNVKIAILKITDDTNSGSVSTRAATAALDYARTNGIMITNNSYKIAEYEDVDYEYRNAAKAYCDAGGLLIAAAGNDYGVNIDETVCYPASFNFDNIITVASTNTDDTLSGFSNIGPESVDLAAPGGWVKSTYIEYINENGVLDRYRYIGGTSQATPHVTGAAVLIKSVNPDFNAGEIKRAIMVNCDVLASLDGTCMTEGRLNVYNAVKNTGSSLYNGYDFDSATGTIRAYYGRVTSLTIPSSINGVAVTSIGNFAFLNNNTLTNITIPSTVTTIGQNAFTRCMALQNIYVNASNQMFESLDGILYNESKSVIVKCPEGKTGTVTIEPTVFNMTSNTFKNCTELTTINLPSFMSVIPQDLFYTCTSLSKVVLPAYLSSGVPDGLFFNCKSITEVSLPSNMQYVPDNTFNGCDSLTTVSLPGGIISIGIYAFSKCLSLETITLPDTLSSISRSAFSGCESLISITLPDCVGYIGDNAFQGCTNLQTANLSKSLLSIGDYCFGDCKELTEIFIPNSVTSIGNTTFAYCENLVKAYLPNNITTIPQLMFDHCTNLTGVMIPNNITTIERSAFFYCTGLTGVTIPSSVTSIGNNVFEGCVNDLTIYGESGSTGSVYANTNSIDFVNVDSLFTVNSSGAITGYSGNLSNVIIPSTVSGVAVRSIPYELFRAKTEIMGVSMPDTLTTIGPYAFFGCSFLRNVTMKNSVTSIQLSAFSFCQLIDSIIISENVTTLDMNAFSNCSALTEIEIPASVTVIGSGIFDGCSSLKNIDVSSSNLYYSSQNGVLYNKNKTTLIRCPQDMNYSFSVPSSVTAISGSAFYKCENISGITLSSSVITVGNLAFYGCRTMLFVSIPGATSSIGNMVFDNCSALINISVNTSNLYDSSLDGVLYNKNKSTLIRCPEGKSGSFTIPSTVTALTSNSFVTCLKLTSITVPQSVVTIPSGAFSGCPATIIYL